MPRRLTAPARRLVVRSDPLETPFRPGRRNHSWPIRRLLKPAPGRQRRRLDRYDQRQLLQPETVLDRTSRKNARRVEDAPNRHAGTDGNGPSLSTATTTLSGRRHIIRAFTGWNSGPRPRLRTAEIPNQSCEMEIAHRQSNAGDYTSSTSRGCRLMRSCWVIWIKMAGQRSSPANGTWDTTARAPANMIRC